MRRAICSLMVTAVVAASGGCHDDLVPFWESGSRLRAQVYVTDDGFRMPIAWRDTALGIDCTFGGSTAGLCAPGFQLLFRDDACTMPASMEPVTAPYVTAAGRAFRPTGAMVRARAYFLSSTTGACQSLVLLEVDQWIVEEVAADTLVAWSVAQLDNDGLAFQRTSADGAFDTYIAEGGEERRVDGVARLSLVYRVIGPYRAVMQIWDRAIELPCDVRDPDGSGALVCAPAVAQPRTYYRDAACTDDVVLAPADPGLAGTEVYDRRVEESLWQREIDQSCEAVDPRALLFARSRSVSGYTPQAVRLEIE